MGKTSGQSLQILWCRLRKYCEAERLGKVMESQDFLLQGDVKNVFKQWKAIIHDN